MKYIETNTINLDELLSSWRMTNEEMDNYIMASRKSHHLFMPTYESLNNIMDEDENKLMVLLTLNDKFFEIIDNDKVIGIATIINNNELTYVVPFKYQRRVLILSTIQDIMKEYNLDKIVRVEDIGKVIKDSLPKKETDYYNDELNIIKKTIDILLNKGYKKEDIFNDINEFMNAKTYQKK
jgi:hypothetical protein